MALFTSAPAARRVFLQVPTWEAQYSGVLPPLVDLFTTALAARGSSPHRVLRGEPSTVESHPT